MPNVVVGSRTDVGRQRVLNEDSVLVGSHVWAVADGMGGHAAGDVASRLAIAALGELDESVELTPDRVQAAVAKANSAVTGHGAEHPEALGLGTTVAGLAEVILAGEHRWAVFNVGDSRVYHYVDGTLEQVSTDHSEVEELLSAGLIDASQARTHPARHIVTRAVGTRPAPAVDLWVLPQTAGERFLICSDGLSDELPDDAISALLADNPSPRAAADALVEAVLALGARDNVTVVIVDLVGADGSDDEITVPRGVLEGEG